MDIYPTILSLVELENPANHIIDGYNLKKQFSGKRNEKRPERFLMHFPHAHRKNYFTSYRDGDWKLIYWYNPESPNDPFWELYNLVEDPYETTDLAGIEKEILSRMIEQMSMQLREEGALYPEDISGQPIEPINNSGA